MPTTERNNDTILTIVDRFSKYVILIPVNIELNAVDTARIFFDEVVCKFGLPMKIISDRDVRF